MCKSSVWLRYPDGCIEKTADNVLVVAQEGDTVVLCWFLAEPRRVDDAIREVDAIKHIISLNVPESPGDSARQPETAASSRVAEAAQAHSYLHPQRRGLKSLRSGVGETAQYVPAQHKSPGIHDKNHLGKTEFMVI
jgi:hypothetical protein